MADGPGSLIDGRVFDAIADEYDRHRPGYPEAILERACEAAGLRPGSSVLEVGCGTGQLTRGLLAHGLRVTAIEPGEKLIARARLELEGADEVYFVNAGLEAPEAAAAWPVYRDLEATLAGAGQRRHNVSEVWAWLGSHDIARGEAALLFEDVEIATLPMRSEYTADEVNAMLGTMSFWARLSPRQRDLVVAENEAAGPTHPLEHGRVPGHSSAAAPALIALSRVRRSEDIRA